MGANAIVTVAEVDEPYRLVNRFVSLLQKTVNPRLILYEVEKVVKRVTVLREQ